MISFSNNGIYSFYNIGSFALAYSNLCLNGSIFANGFLASSLNSYIRNSFLVSLINLMIFSFLGSLTSIYNYLNSILFYSSKVYSFLFLYIFSFLNIFSVFIGGISGPSPFHSTFKYISPLISFDYYYYYAFSNSYYVFLASSSYFCFYFYSSVNGPEGTAGY
jgi:hypothetical protein